MKNMYCILTITRYPKWLGFAGFFSMALFRFFLWFNKKTSFWKLLGCGKNGSFDIKPDLRQWGILLVVESHKIDEMTLKNIAPFIYRYITFFKCEIFSITMQPIEGYGKWNGRNCFGDLKGFNDYEGIICVLTRATIRLNRVKNFLKHTQAVSAQMLAAPGFLASVGIGEVPFIKQATFSIWKSKTQMKDFAYGMKKHIEVIKKTRDEKWYSEEMFVRFKPILCSGTLNGVNPLERIL